MKQTIVLSIYIHKEGYNSYSSKDFSGYKVFDFIEEVEHFISEYDFSVEKAHKDSDLNLIYYRLKGYDKAKRMDECKKLFDEDKPEILDKLFKKEEYKKYAKRKDEGFIYCKSFDNMTAKDYEGSLEKLLTNYVKDYIKINPCGYLGHYYRKHSTDKILEKIAQNYTVESSLVYTADVYECIGCWLTSGSARHWMDNHEDDTDDEFEEAVKNHIEEMIIWGFSYKYDYEYTTASKTITIKKI